MTNTMLRVGVALLASLTAFAATAQTLPPLSPQKPVLRAEALINGDVVRIGDLVDNAGIIANVPIFRAPDLGATGSVSADAVVEAVRAHALIGLDTNGVSEVVVTRASRAIPAKQIEDAVAAALSKQFALGEPRNIAVGFERELRAIQVEPTSQGEPRVARINYDARTNRFDVTLEIPTSVTSRGMLRLSGRAVAAVDVITMLRPVERGAILKDGDVGTERRARADTARDVLSDATQAIGLAARGSLQPGRPLRSADLMKPELVGRNETITLAYQIPGIMLTVRGKALDAGAEGDVINVLNEQSKRTVQGVVVSPGRVMVTSAQAKLAANLSTDNAQR
jgi:flagellar basal body P-ring formation protein FlgA